MTIAVPFPFPERQSFLGRYCHLAPYDDSIHGHQLWEAIKHNPEIFAHLPYGPWETEVAFRQWLIDAINLWKDQICFVVNDISGRPMGCKWLHDISTQHGSIEIGGIFFSSAAQRTCLSTESFYLLATYIFDQLKYRRLQWRCSTKNEKSKNAAIRFGFTYEGIFRQHMIVKAANRDTIWYSLLDTEWPHRKTCFERWLCKSNFDELGNQKASLERAATNRISADADH